MSWKRFLCGVGCAALAWGQASAADPVVSSYYTNGSAAQTGGIVLVQDAKGAPATPQTPVRPEAPRPADTIAPPSSDAFAQGPSAGTEAAASANPQMLGDSIAYVNANSSIVSPGQAHPVTGLAGSAFKIADNESPRPQDRVFVNADFFTSVLKSIRSSEAQAGGATATPLRLSREVFGFEKTFLDGNASVEVRLPFFQFHDQSGASFSDFGDVTVIGKYALVNEHGCDGDTVLSGGIAVTVPTGPNDTAGTTSINPFILQPFVGALLGNENAYLHGFSSVALPFSDSVGSIWFNDIGFGYYVYKSCDGCIRGIVPTAEGHFTTGLGHIGAQGSPTGVIDQVVVTGGLHMLFANHANLTFGYEFPVTGPLVFKSEYVVQFNWHF
jgi:hypothetical protein